MKKRKSTESLVESKNVGENQLVALKQVEEAGKEITLFQLQQGAGLVMNTFFKIRACIKCTWSSIHVETQETE